MVRNGLIIFNSVHKVMKAEKALKKAGFDVRIMPVPRMLSSDCGLSLAFQYDRAQELEECLLEAGCAPEEVYRLVDEVYVKVR